MLNIGAHEHILTISAKINIIVAYNLMVWQRKNYIPRTTKFYNLRPLMTAKINLLQQLIR